MANAENQKSKFELVSRVSRSDPQFMAMNSPLSLSRVENIGITGHVKNGDVYTSVDSRQTFYLRGIMHF